MSNAPKILMMINPNGGYAADQVEEMTLADLLQAVEDAISEFGEEATFATYDAGNRYGAKYGSLEAHQPLFIDPVRDWGEGEDEDSF